MKKNKIDMPLLEFFEELVKPQEPIFPPLPPEVQFIYDSILPVKPKYRPIGNQQTYMLVIKNQDGKEVSHWSCEEIDVENFKLSSENRGKVVEKYTSEEYWRKYHLGDFQMR